MADVVVSSDKIGFIIMDVVEIHFGTLSGDTREILHIMNFYLAQTMRILEDEGMILLLFIDRVSREPNVSGLILAGADGFKTELSQSDEFVPLLKEKILNISEESPLWKPCRGANEEETP